MSGKKYNLMPIRLGNVRPFKFDMLDLTKIKELKGKENNSMEIEKVVIRKVKQMIDSVQEEC